MFCVLGCGSTTAEPPPSDAGEVGLDVYPDLETPEAAVEVQDTSLDVAAQDSMALDVASQPETQPDKPSKQSVTFVIRNNLDEGRWVYADANFCATWVVGIDGELPPSSTVPSGGPDLVDTYSFVLLLPTEHLELQWDARVRENGALVPAAP
ncbi:MAG: hypothetical protein HY898_12415 [Deltaproteobacteria bacterium]|nr:hypothetical protein [Deltaproteobacteria bacterium]